MVVKIKPSWVLFIISLAALFMLNLGCKSITESDYAYQGEVTVLTPELSIVATLSIRHEVASLLIYPGHILVATTDGVIFSYDSETLECQGEYTIGPPSSSGYSDMIYRPSQSAIYILGAFSNILEISLQDMTVADIFSVCPYPVDLVNAGDDSPYIYTADGSSNELIRINTQSNTTAGFETFNESIRVMAPLNTDSLLVSTSSRILMVFEAGAQQLTSYSIFFAGSSGLGSTASSDVAVALISEEIGLLSYELSPDSIYEWLFTDEVAVPGTGHLLCSDPYSHAVVATYTEDDLTEVCRYSYSSGAIMNQVELTGYPIDIRISSSGYVYVLTAFQ